ncbi:hypothetical protein Ana3638_04270 [Anaerocolumna sedimenticola]|uniref:Uncharacterized protein n=1 Tax=Anaerocolumna sedimenticola TaxID=2696063 RepID=A0A6P1TKC5_9FIRM|nr:hypothetical protein [Anaerocolumna sedimenticola]QHQ60095.1 hypothetical protein Ana3638_04270 [Anaerocolumna sedimenticola]
MKKVMAFLLTAVMLLSFSATAYAAETVDTEKGAQVFETNSVVTPYAWYYSYTKTITKTYASLYDVPDSIEYSEYNSGVDAECSGTLNLKYTMLQSNGTYKATFVGTIGAYVF